MNNTLSITEYNLLDYSLRLQEAFDKGYRISDNVNDSPMKIGNAYTATVSMVEKEVAADVVSEAQLELPQEVIPVENTLTEMLQAADEQCDKVEAVVEDVVSKVPSKRGRK